MADHSKPVWSPDFLRGTTDPTVSETIDDFLEVLDRGSARDRYGRPFTPEAVGELQWLLGGHVDEELGDIRLRELRRGDVEALIYELADGGVPRRRLRALAKSVRALYDYAAELDLVRHNPAERVAIPDEDEAEQPMALDAGESDPGPQQGMVDRAISLSLRLATIAFLLVAAVLLAGSM